METDMQWTRDMSPYLITEPVLVPQGVTLEIEPGVQVNMNGTHLRVEGTFRSVGTSALPVIFTGSPTEMGGNFVVIAPESEPWNPDTGEGTAILYTFFNLSTAVGDAALQIDRSAPLLHRISVTNSRATGVYLDGPAILEDSVLCDNYRWGARISASATVRRNVICNNRETGLHITGGEPLVEQNLIRANNWLDGSFRGGVNIEFQREDGNIMLLNNTIVENRGYGVRVIGERVPADLVIKGNTIANNFDFDAELGDTNYDVDMSGNWWGTSDRDYIENRLRDEDFGFGLREIRFLPRLNEASPEAPPNP